MTDAPRTSSSSESRERSGRGAGSRESVGIPRAKPLVIFDEVSKFYGEVLA